TRSGAPRCGVWRPPEPRAFGPARALDKVRWKLFHRPVQPPFEVTADGELRPSGVVSRGLLGAAGLLGRLGR
ncbi:MAG TPA: hypothetical protein VFN44_11415, partial [Solirubrobacteraceae bacterium]|nr:hypothetical protein [Solirubrobacteraceae bacterium]